MSDPDSFEAYAADRTGVRATDWLRDRAEPAWGETVGHRFVRELGDDTLDDDVFRRYLEQDYAFVGTLVGTFGHAVGDAPSMSAKARFVDFLGTLTDEENDYFERSFDALGGDADADPGPTTLAFMDLLERAAGEGGYAETLAVLVAAEWSYATWATGVDDPRPERFYFDEWIDLHANRDFLAFVDWLRAELDRDLAAAAPRRTRRIERLFRRAVELEREFFTAAYDA